MRFYHVWIVFICVVFFSACSKKEEVAAPAGDMAQSASRLGSQESPLVSTPTRKYVAFKHRLTLQTEADLLQADFQAILDNCEKLNCQIITANITKQTDFEAPYADLSARVPPPNWEGFYSNLQKYGEIISHERESEDKTVAVIDAEAKITNLTSLRDRLRLMLANRTMSAKDAVETERELANVQAELDTITGVRSALAKETDLIFVQVHFRAKQTLKNKASLTPVVRAWNDAGSVLMSSLGGLITFIAAVLPWLVIIIPLFVGLRRLWRRRKGTNL